jgi:flagellar motor protein MotB
MRPHLRHSDYAEEFNIWPAFTDLMSNAFMIAILLLLLSIVQVGKLKQQLAGRTPTDAPPIILIQNTGAYQFASGSAELPEALNSYVRGKLVNEIESNAKAYQIDVVEVIGHTDGQPNGRVSSNLDNDLEKVARGQIPIHNLQAGSNADLGLMRALELVRVLRSIQQHGTRLKGLEFRAYSAAQLISPTGNLTPVNQQSDPRRRRIEIRFTRLGKVTNVH